MGFFNPIDWVVSAIAGQAQTEAAKEAAVSIAQEEAIKWAADLGKIDYGKPMDPYEGPQFNPVRSGWPVQFGFQAYGSVGVAPAGTFFVGHLPPCLFDSLRLTMHGPQLIDDPKQQSGVLARVVQRNADGQTLFISGLELGYQEDGTLVRQDLRLPAKSPYYVEERYAGPFIESLPTFLVIAGYGDWAGVSSIEKVSVQATLTLLCQTLT